MEHPFEWHDWLRVGSIVICSISIWLLGQSWFFNHTHWNAKTTDYWYALTSWCIAGIVLCIEGIYNDFEFGPRSVFVIMASCITLKAVVSKDRWGSDSAAPS